MIKKSLPCHSKIRKTQYKGNRPNNILDFMIFFNFQIRIAIRLDKLHFIRRGQSCVLNEMSKT